MKTAEQLLLELHSLNVNLWSEGERLRYQATKGTLTPTLLEELREHKAELLKLLQSTNVASNANNLTILSAPRSNNLPLSFAQQRLWFLKQLYPNNNFYNITVAYHLKGKVNIKFLEESLVEITKRHETLRTTFTSLNGQPNQIISQEITSNLLITDLRQIPEHQRYEKALQIANQQAQQPFDITLHQNWRLQLLCLAEEEYILCFTIDHLICDGWSMRVFFKELTTLYKAFSNGKSSPLSELPIQYVDFAVWQRNYLQGKVLESQLNYWKQQLSGEQLLKLPTDRPRPPIQTTSGATQPLTITAELTQALTNISQREKVTLFITLLAAFQTLLYRYTGQEDIIVGSPIAGRNQIETEGLIGFFINTLPLRTNLAGNPSFQELLTRVNSVALDAYNNQDVPFEKIVEELRLPRDTSRSPLFQVMFAFENSETILELPSVTVTPLKIYSGAAKFDITLSMKQTPQGLAGFFEYNIDLFDAATFEIWGALLHGGRLVIITKDVLLSPQEFANQIAREQISVLFLTTALFNQLVSIVPSAFHNLRYLLFGGEAVEPKWVRILLEQSPLQKLLHVYRPTEGTTFSSCYLVQEVLPCAATVPIGRPISNTQIYILDALLRPVPIGVVGELYIGGDGLAKGYLNRPELTTEKFIPNPFSAETGARLYKTGDCARYLADGNIEYVGRIDEQVKIRGFRVELREIEIVLAQHKGVKETAVTTLSDATGNNILVAYVVSDQQHLINYDELRYFLKQKLPKYMAPNIFVKLDALPLTPNGKLDRRLLPTVSETYLKSERAYVSPQNQLERDIANIWEKVLGIDCISINDNFFELGGHSLLAVRLITQIEQELGKKLPIVTLFQAPTIKQLASVLRQENSVSSIVEVTPLNGNVTPLFWCTPHLNYNLNLLAKYIGASQPLFGLDGGYFNIENTDTHIKDYAARYVKEIRAIQPNGPYKLGGYCMGGLVAFEIAQQLRAQGEQCDLLALIERSGLNPIHRRCTSIVVAIDGHINNLAQLTYTQRLIYICKFLKKICLRTILKFKKGEIKQKSNLNASSVNATLIQQKALASVKKYSLQQPYPGNIILLFAEKNNHLSFFFPKYGWSKAVTGKIEISLVSGNHVSVTEEPDIQQVAAKLKFYLDKL